MRITSYQIVLFSSGADSLVETLKRTVENKFLDLGIERGLLAFFDDSNFGSVDPAAPTVAVFIGLKENPVAPESLRSLVRGDTLVIPVIDSLAGVESHVVEELRGINVMRLSPEDPNLEGVVAVVLEGFNLLRKRRRLFISYRRTETQGVAIQLYECLDRHGFDVFLDTLSIRPGEPFQQVLWQRLADTDVIVLLDSPGFMQSRWTTQELARANSTNIQILQLVWPTTQFESSAAFSRPIVLSDDDFEDAATAGPYSKLKSSVAERVATEVESLRARALAARYTYLVEEFCSEAKTAGLMPRVQPERFITIEPQSGKFVAAVPAIGVPDAVRYHEAELEVARHPLKHSQIVLLYDERGIQEQWLSHLKWLNRHGLPVQSVQVAESFEWLESLK
jgi:hypothetical protein